MPDWKETLNLPRTGFRMKASLPTTEPQAIAMVVSGFIEPIVKELPMEYAVEMNRLIELQMEGSIG